MQRAVPLGIRGSKDMKKDANFCENKKMPSFFENLHNLLVSLRSPRHSCLPVQQLLAFGSLIVTGTTRFSTEKKGKFLFLRLVPYIAWGSTIEGPWENSSSRGNCRGMLGGDAI